MDRRSRVRMLHTDTPPCAASTFAEHFCSRRARTARWRELARASPRVAGALLWPMQPCSVILRVVRRSSCSTCPCVKSSTTLSIGGGASVGERSRQAVCESAPLPSWTFTRTDINQVARALISPRCKTVLASVTGLLFISCAYIPHRTNTLRCPSDDRQVALSSPAGCTR